MSGVVVLEENHIAGNTWTIMETVKSLSLMETVEGG